MKWHPPAVIVVFFTCAVAANGAAVTLHVSSQGNDANTGTAQRPMATLTAARDKVRPLISAGLTADVRIVVHGGVYRVTEPLTFGPRDSGTAERRVTYAAAPNDKPVISGGVVQRGWRDNGDGTWSVAVKQTGIDAASLRELFINGQRRPRARHPNKGFARIVATGPDKRTSFTFHADDVPARVTAAGLEVLFLHDWSTSRVAVKSVDRASRTLTVADPIGCQAPHYRIDHFEQHPRYRLENHPALLDEPGEWCVDAGKSVLTYRPKRGERIDSVEAIIPMATALLAVRGEPGRPVRNLHFEGLRFEHCAWPIPKGGYAAGQAGFHERRDGANGNELRQFIPAAVTFEVAERCSFTHGRVERVGGSGVWFGSRCQHCVLEGNVVADVAGNGVMIGEDRERRVDGRAWWQAAPQQASSHNAVRHNLIERCGRLYFGAVGVWVGFAQHTRIEHNEIRHLPYTGVSVGWMWNPTPTPCHHNRVERNHIHHVMQTLSDGGGIYTLGRQPGTMLAGNVIHDVPVNAGRAESNGMFLDEGTTELVIENNVIYGLPRSPLRFHRAGKNLVRGNVLVTGSGAPVVRYNTTNAADIKQVDNRVIAAQKWNIDQPTAEAQRIIGAAGLRGEYRKLLKDAID